MDNDVSVCVIPDTPSPAVPREKFSQRHSSVVEILSDNSFGMASAMEQNISGVEGKSPSGQTTTTTDSANSASKSSPVFSCKRKILDSKSGQNLDYDMHKANMFSVKVNISPLPGSPEFARKRAEAVQKKVEKNKLSPFTKSKYDLSPFKVSVNQLSACSSKEAKKSDLSSNRLASSPHKTELMCERKEIGGYSGFVKSSSLLGKERLDGNAVTVSGIKLFGPDKTKKRKVESTANVCVHDVVRPKVQKVKATYGWLSSSDSSDDESSVFKKSKKIKKTIKGSGRAHSVKNSHLFKKSDFDSVNTEQESNSSTLLGTNMGEKAHKTCTLTKSADKNEPDSTTAACKSKVARKGKDEKGKAVRKTRISGKACHGPIEYLDTSDDEILRSIEECILLGHEKPVPPNTNHVAERISNLPTTQMQDLSSVQLPSSIATTSGFSTPASSHMNSPMYWTPSLQVGTKSPDLKNVHNKSNSYTSPVLSFHVDRSMIPGACLQQQSSPHKKKKKKVTKSHRSVPSSLLQDSPIGQLSEGPQGASSGSPLGSQDNPIDLVSATPETRKALEEIKQLQDDEEFARKMQEQLDLEFAMSLQNGEESHSLVHGNVPQEASGHSLESTSSHHWHAYSPTRAREPDRSQSGGPRRRGRTGVNPDDAFLHLVRQTIGTLNAELGPASSDNLQYGWLANTPSAGRRRRGRGQSIGHFSVFSPAAEGEDYENLMNLAEMLGEVKDKGLSKSDLVRLPVVTYKKTEGQEIEECNICMTDYEDGDSQKILPCFHTFHCLCIDKWIKKNATCPICRVEVKVTSP